MTYNKNEFAASFRKRTKENAIKAIRLFRKYPKTEEGRIVGKQFLRSATSVAANYRAACRARSKAEFFSKLSICVEEADETVFWLEITEESEILMSEELNKLKIESEEILKVLASARKTVNNS